MNIGIENALLNLNAMQPRFDRGYTGHEHMCGFGLINMNGRLYDPYLQRFLSPDPYIISPGNAQDYNRYSYVLNNPLIYIDPSGYSRGGASFGYSIGTGREARVRFLYNDPLPFPVGGAVWQTMNFTSNWFANYNQGLANMGYPIGFSMHGLGIPGFSGSFGNPFSIPGANWAIDFRRPSYQQTLNLRFWNNFLQNLLQEESGYTITPIEHLGRIILIGHFGPLGPMVFGPGGGGYFLNPTAAVSMPVFERLDFKAQRGGEPSLPAWMSWANNSINTAAYWAYAAGGSAGMLSRGAIRYYSNAWKGNQYVKTFNLTKLGQGVGVGTSIVGAGIGVTNFILSNQSWGDYGALGISLLSAGLTFSGYTAPIGIGIGFIDAAGGFNSFYNFLDVNEQLYNRTGGIIIPRYGLPFYLQIRK